MFIIGITGGTASGKTTIVENSLSNFNKNDIGVISQDSYYKQTDDLTHVERIAINFDHPQAIDFDLLVQQINFLKNGATIQQPVYSFHSHNRTNEQKYFAPKKIIIVEGILIFNDKRLLDLFDLKIFIEADADERLRRRIIRDSNERGRDANEVINRYRSTLKPMHDLYIEPHKKNADLIFNNTVKENNNSQLLTDLIQKKLTSHS